MDVDFGPDVDGVRITPGEHDKQLLTNTATACYNVGKLCGAHDPDSAFGQAFIDAQHFAVELMKFSGTDLDRGIGVNVDTVVSAAVATAFHEYLYDNHSMRDAASAWGSIVVDIHADTADRAMDLVTHGGRDVPADPWATDDDE